MLSRLQRLRAVAQDFLSEPRISLLSRARAQWLIELGVVFSVIIVATAATVGISQLTTLSPHPFWIAVLLLACQHGTLAGVAAAIFAMVLHWCFDMATAVGIGDMYDYLNRVWLEPTLWLVAAVVLGGLRTRQVQKTEFFTERFAEAQAKLTSVTALARQSRSQCEHLERHIACSADRSVEAGLGALEAVRASTRDALADRLSRAVRILIGPASYTVFTVHDGRLFEEANLVFVQSDAPRLPPLSKLPEELEIELMRARRLLTLRREEDLAILAGLALIAAPIVSGPGGRVAGVLLVRSMDPMRITPECELSICFLCRALADALSRERVVVSFARERALSRGLGTTAAEDGAAPARTAE
jgi:polysaccharide biosynthesis protein PelD